MNELIEIQIFKDNIDTIREVSFDVENKVHMIDSDVNVVNFDKVKTKYANNLKLSEEVSASVDALGFTEDSWVFIEFKNGKMQNEKRQIKVKIKDSLLIFCDIAKKNISETRKRMDFVLVYNEKLNPLPNQITREVQASTEARDKIGKYFMKKANKELILYNLENFQTLYFKAVHTYTENEFIESYLPLLKSI